jgi:hypothetical protein
MSKPTGRPNGRPPLYTKELADSILFRICEGESLRAITREEEMPNFSTVYRWILDDEDGFCNRYASAREIQAANYAEQALEESESALDVASGAPGTGEAGARVMAKKLHIDSLKWIAGKLDSPKWGHKTATEISGPDGGAIPTSKVIELTPELEAKLDLINQVSSGMKKPEGIE